MKETIGILAHVDAGKTTFSEQLLFHTNSIKLRGRVDHKNAFLDSHSIERERGITVFADQGIFTYGDSTYYLVDTPGHVDFSPEMERAIQIMDYAIVIVSAVEGIEGHTETVWELLRKHRVPTFFFINKTDRIGANPEQVMQEIQQNFSIHAVDLTDSFENGGMKEGLIEWLAEQDDTLLEHYLENGYSYSKWVDTMKKRFSSGLLFPCTTGSALQDIGINSFLEKLECLTETAYKKEGTFSAHVYKIRHDEKGTRLTFMKALTGALTVRDEIKYGDALTIEKVTQIRVYNGDTFQVVERVEAGELFAVVGLTKAEIGDGIGPFTKDVHYEMFPTLKAKVLFEPSVHIREALVFFKQLDAEDPSLNVIWDETLQEIHIHVMGAIQLEVLEQIVSERYGIQVTFADPEILYKETIKDTVVGYGHFEPLGHYAEVHLQIEEGERNSGIVFENKCHPDELIVGYQNLVQQHLFERDHHGILTGSPLTDVKITLLTGRAHNKHTSGGDFREATFRAIRQGLEKAKNRLLEPVYQYKIKVDIDQMGKVLTDIQQAYGHYETPQAEGDKAVLTGTVPVATFMDYPNQLASYTQGRGAISLVFAGYDRCHNEEKVMERKNYNKDADPEYTSSSIFCAKGVGYSVPWNEAEGKMHAL
ncbi:TetM/TetW/TetO/TetS family tetracycline resistance ribosomal protection protein [Bacillus carboniphilus]|uniref:TetM/TetW/TetO/TetS family tetracycline resistance ribosomal protection protein n=1 Tax=Bacillus carboniphilus TaxID=86663 RepID=A0ABN0VQP0_9BACI